VCCLLALAFFHAFKHELYHGKQFSLTGFLSLTRFASQEGKLLCLLGYFERLRISEEENAESFLSMHVSISRRKLSAADAREIAWEECSQPLVAFESLSRGRIEDAQGCLQVDFANANIGGGVLGLGCVQVSAIVWEECLCIRVSAVMWEECLCVRVSAVMQEECLFDCLCVRVSAVMQEERS